MKLRIDYLKNHSHLIPEIAKYLYGEWSYMRPEKILWYVEDALRDRMNVKRLPLALVALLNEQFAGIVSLKIHDLETRKDLSPWLAGLYVKEEYRNQGIGKKLTEAAVQKAKALHIKKLYLFTPNAARYYERSGWKAMCSEVYNGSDVAVMERDVG